MHCNRSFLVFIISFLCAFFNIFSFAQEKVFSLPKNMEARQRICQRVEKKLVAYIDLIFYVKNCVLRPIDDSSLINELILNQKKEVISFSDNTYSLLSLSSKYTYEEYNKDYLLHGTPGLASLCLKYDKSLITSDNYLYYYIDSCKKRAFLNYHDLFRFNTEMSSVHSISPSLLNVFPDGKPMVVKNDKVLLKEKTESQIKADHAPMQIFCKKFNKRVVSFHDSFFFLENCALLKINDLSIDLQIKSDALGGIQELTVAQVLSIPHGGKIKESAVLQKL